MTDWDFVTSNDGTEVPLKHFPAKGVDAPVFLMLPALGVEARFYRRLAEGIAATGVTTVLMEQRGHGKSRVRAKRGDSFGYRDFLENDIPAAVAAVTAQYPEKRLYIGGHSLGGHLSSIIAGRQQEAIRGVIHLACGFPYHGLFDAKAAGKVKLLSRLIPLTTVLFGYFPGHRIGFGGREYRQLMMDWREWALRGNYNIAASPDAEREIASFSGPVLSVSFDKDFYASDEAIAYSHSRFKTGDVTTIRLTAKEQGDFLGHFDWAKNPAGVVKAISGWIER